MQLFESLGRLSLRLLPFCRYAGLLEAAMLCHVPEVSPIESKDLLDFCADSGYNCRLEPAGTLLIPPEYNVGMTDWERSLRLRQVPPLSS